MSSKTKSKQKIKKQLSLDDEVNEVDEKTYTLVSSDNVKFTVKQSVCLKSDLLKTAIENDSSNSEIPLSQTTSRNLGKILEYLTYHVDHEEADIDRPIQTSDFKTLVCEWDYNFINANKDIMFDIMTTSNYLGINSLINIIAAKTATMIKEKSPEEIRKQFNIVNDFTPEEEEQIRKEMPL